MKYKFLKNLELSLILGFITSLKVLFNVGFVGYLIAVIISTTLFNMLLMWGDAEIDKLIKGN